MATATCELKWLKGLLRSFGFSHQLPVHLHCDSQSTLHITSNPVFHERTKHIDDCHFVLDALQAGLISTYYFRTGEQLADIFTKAVSKTQFDFFLRKLGTRDPHAPT